MDEHRRSRRPQITSRRELALTELLVEVLDDWARTVELHDDCPSCGVDLDIATRKARALGLRPSERRATL